MSAYRSQPYIIGPLITVLLAVAAHGAGAQSTAAPSARLVGDVVGQEAGNPLAHSMVTLVGPEQRQTFTTDAGVFDFADLPPGSYHLRAAHIGYTPVELAVEVPATGSPPRLRISLTHVAVQLAAVKVVAAGSCTRPGRPDPNAQPDLATIVQQLRLNAEQYRLLTDSFPFRYKVYETYQSMRGDSSRTNTRMETEDFQSDRSSWEYHVGDMTGRLENGQEVMFIPTLRDFASFEFLNNHCFQYAGMETTHDGSFIRITFQADVQLRTPDVNGTVWLDAHTYQIRRTELQLTRIPPDLPQVTASRVTTIFGEVAPSIDVVQEVHGITSIRHSRWGGFVATTEDQRTVGFQWVRTDPSHPAAAQP